MAYFHDDKKLEAMADLYPATRKDLLRFLWSSGLTNIDIVKAGPNYLAMAGGKIFATHIRRINDLSFACWRKRFSDLYFPP